MDARFDQFYTKIICRGGECRGPEAAEIKETFVSLIVEGVFVKKLKHVYTN